LVKKAGEIGGGDLDQRIELKRSDEFGELAEPLTPWPGA